MEINTNPNDMRGNGTISQGSDSALWAIFKTVQEPMAFLSEQEKRPIFKPYEYIEIHLPEGKNVVSRRATDADRRRFPQQYAAFKANQTQTPIGTPLESWGVIDESRCYELKALKIFTVEQVAEASDQTLQVMGPDARNLREKARGYLTVKERAAQASIVEEENAALKARLAAIEERIAAQSHFINGPIDAPVVVADKIKAPKKKAVKALPAPAAPKKGRGRPKKAVVVAEPFEEPSFEPDESQLEPTTPDHGEM